MDIKSGLRFLKQLSILKTFYLNFKYFNLITAIKLPILVSKNVRIRNACGHVHIGDVSPGIIRLGFDIVGIFDNRKSSSIWEVDKNSIIEFEGKTILGSGSKICVGGG